MLKFPDRLRVSSSTFTPANQSVSGGQGMTGFQQWLTSPRGRWTAKVTCQVVGEEEVLTYQAFLGSLQGSGVECLVTPRDGIRPRDVAGRVLPWRMSVPWANGALWFSGVGWAAPPRIDALALPAAQGATTITIEPAGPGVRPGHYIGLADRVYRVLQANPNPGNPAAQDLVIWPRLRAAAASNQPVLLAAPVCRMRLKSDDSGPLDLRWREQSTPTLDFVESYPVPTT